MQTIKSLRAAITEANIDKLVTEMMSWCQSAVVGVHQCYAVSLSTCKAQTKRDEQSSAEEVERREVGSH